MNNTEFDIENECLTPEDILGENIVIAAVPEEVTRIEPQNRLRSWALWLSVAGALWIIAEAFGLPEQWGITEEKFRTVLNALGTILTGFGILNNPRDRANF